MRLDKLAALHHENQALRGEVATLTDLLQRAAAHGRHDAACPAVGHGYDDEIAEWADCACWKGAVWDRMVMLVVTAGGGR